MKKNILYTVVSIVLLLSACKDNEPDPTLAVARETISFQIEGGTQSVDVITNAGSVRAVSADKWCTATVQPVSGGFKLDVSLSKHTGIGPRNTTITLVTGNLYADVKVSQEGRDQPVLKVTPGTFSGVSFRGAILPVDVETNIDYTVRTDYDSKEATGWVSVTPSEDRRSLEIEVAANETPAVRKAVIVLEGEGVEAKISIEQEEKSLYIEVLPAKIKNIPVEGGTYTATIHTNVAGYQVTKPAWVTVTPSADDASSLSIVVDENPTAARQGKILFSGMGKSAEIVVEQDGQGATLPKIDVIDEWVSVSSFQDFIGLKNHMLDNNSETCFVTDMSQILPQWISIALKTGNPVHTFSFHFKFDQTFLGKPKTLEVQVSSDGASWTTVRTLDNLAADAIEYTSEAIASEIPVNHLRFKVTNAHNALGVEMNSFAIAELEIYGR